MSLTQKNYPEIELYIDGKWLKGAGDIKQEIINPATEEVIGSFTHASADDIEVALASTQTGFLVWRKLSAYERAALMRKAAQNLREHALSYGQWMTLEQGKPLVEGRGEIMFCADIIDWFAAEAQRTHGQVIPSRSLDVVQYSFSEPIGPVAAFTPWNFPAAQAARKIAMALAAGCSIVLKGAEDTPASCLALIQAFEQAGLPAGVLNLLFGNPSQISETLIADNRIRKVSFTGSTLIGKQLASLAGQHMKPVTMELGGHAPVLVFNDIDVDRAVQIMVGAKYRNAGQVCISPTRFMIQEEIYNEFVDKFSALASSLRVGNGMNEETQMGPLVTKRRLEAVANLVEKTKQQQGEVLTGGRRLDGPGYFYAPTVVHQTPLDADIESVEPFGPIALMRSFREIEEAVQYANRLDYGLSSYVFASASNTLDQVCTELEVGMVSVNQYGIAYPELPFGGVKDSGFGTEGGTEAINAYLTTKFVTRARA